MPPNQKQDNVQCDERAIEEYKHELSRRLEDYKAKLNLELEERRLYNEEVMAIWRAVYEYAQTAIRTVIIANGAAATAILTFMGGTYKAGTASVPSGIAHSL